MFIALQPGKVEVADADTQRIHQDGRVVKVDMTSIHANHNSRMGKILTKPVRQLAGLDGNDARIAAAELLMENVERSIVNQDTNVEVSKDAEVGKWCADLSY